MNALRQNSIATELKLMLDESQAEDLAFVPSATLFDLTKAEYVPADRIIESLDMAIKRFNENSSCACDFIEDNTEMLPMNALAFYWERVNGGDIHTAECPFSQFEGSGYLDIESWEHDKERHSCVRNGCGKSYSDDAEHLYGVKYLSDDGTWQSAIFMIDRVRGGWGL